jgi:aspartyl-tRNA(Asn)/glutamyl-tRNA(Gln) amidotransferase subunit A
MKLFPDEDETIAGAGRRMRQGEITCLAIVRTCLDRIDHEESAVRAWVLVDRDGAERQAQALDDELKAGHDRGPLHGIPIGIKDIMDVKGWPTGCGSPRPTERIESADAPVVSRLREAGAVILGKTVTTAYACLDPPVTRNPWNLKRTPGGSSSGSAAAVACGMCLGALGTQTGGSITRPAAFCGVAGMKPSYGRISTRGILPLAPSLDHVGPIARSVADLRAIYRVIRDPAGSEEEERIGEARVGKGLPRLGVLRGYFENSADEEMRRAISAFSTWFGVRGAKVADVPDPVDFEELFGLHHAIIAREASAIHRERMALMPEGYPPRIAELVRDGETVTDADFKIAVGLKPRRVRAFEPVFESFEVLVCPPAKGAAPDLSTTGDPALNSPWSYLGFPTVTFPLGYSADGMPLGVQLIGKPGADLSLLLVAEWCEETTSSAH